MKCVVRVLTVATVSTLTSLAAAQELKLPPEVTPALRAACESDVRRLCIGENPTVASVRSCVVRRYLELSSRCKVQIAMAGLTPAGR
jgi:hypothetical protein